MPEGKQRDFLWSFLRPSLTLPPQIDTGHDLGAITDFTEFTKLTKLFWAEYLMTLSRLRKEWFLLLVREVFDPEHGK